MSSDAAALTLQCNRAAVSLTALVTGALTLGVLAMSGTLHVRGSFDRAATCEGRVLVFDDTTTDACMVLDVDTYTLYRTDATCAHRHACDRLLASSHPAIDGADDRRRLRTKGKKQVYTFPPPPPSTPAFDDEKPDIVGEKEEDEDEDEKGDFPSPPPSTPAVVHVDDKKPNIVEGKEEEDEEEEGV